MKTSADWLRILVSCGVRAPTAGRWAPHFSAVIQPGTFSLGPAEIDDFLGQVLHESGMLERVEEGLTYTTAERLCAIWPSRFPTVQAARPYVRNPAGLAERVYGGRMGNEKPGDAYAYRGSGPIQVTGKANFAAMERIIGLPLLANPDLLRRPGAEALRVCIAWWEGNVPDGVMGDIVKVTKRVNGGTIGLDHRRQVTNAADRADGVADGRLS